MTPARDRDDIEPSAGGKAQRLEALESEVDQLHQAVRSHTIVDQAIGVLVAVGQLSPAEGGTCCARFRCAPTSSCVT